MPKQNILRVALLTAAVLLIPAIAMRFTSEVRWDWVDFVAAGVLLFGAGMAYELMARRAHGSSHRLAVGLAVVTALALIWMNLAVGIGGPEGAPADLAYFGVVVVLIAGVLLSRWRPVGMARALLAAASAQALVTAAVLIAGLHQHPDDFPASFLIVNSVFILLWTVSALLFRQVHFANRPSRH